LSHDAVPRNLVCCKFYDQDFDTACLHHSNFMDIPTPAITAILDYQTLDLPSQEMFFALLGRLLYGENDRENWQVALFIKGVEQRVISAIGTLVQQFFQKEDVMSGTVDKLTRLDAAVDKLLIVCTGVTNTSKIHPFTSAIPVIFTGRDMGQWQDTIKKKLLVCEFNKYAVDYLDSNLDDKLAAELPTIIFKCQQAYMAMVSKCTGRCIWEVAPSCFKRIQQAVEINPIKRFLMKPRQFIFGENMMMQLDTFISSLCRFFNINGIEFEWNMNMLQEALKERNLKLTITSEGASIIAGLSPTSDSALSLKCGT
jgi:hypothetical protein